MQPSATNVSYDPNRLLDTLCNWLGIQGDKALARTLQISRELIRHIREGRMPLPASILLQMAECANKSIDELRVVLGDRRRKARLSCKIPGMA